MAQVENLINNLDLFVDHQFIDDIIDIATEFNEKSNYNFINERTSIFKLIIN